jgi:hypothetical protein
VTSLWLENENKKCQRHLLLVTSNKKETLRAVGTRYTQLIGYLINVTSTLNTS